MTGWQRVATADQVQIRAWAEKYPGINFGVPCGSQTHVVVVDVDGYQGGRLRDIPIRPTVISTSGRGFHAWYRANGTVIQGGDKKFGAGLGLRGEGHFVVAPGSLHVNGKHDGRHRWGWENFAQRPVLKISEMAPTGVTPLAGPLPEEIPEGHRRTVMLSLAGSMRRRGSTGEAILAALVVENRTRCVPPLGEDELRSIAFDVEGRYQPQVVQVPEPEQVEPEELLVPLDWQALLKDGVPPVDYLDPPYFVRGHGPGAGGHQGRPSPSSQCGRLQPSLEPATGSSTSPRRTRLSRTSGDSDA